MCALDPPLLAFNLRTEMQMNSEIQKLEVTKTRMADRKVASSPAVLGSIIFDKIRC
jgi:hypothetical protein